MIEKNLGTIERLLRFIAGLLVAGWAVSRPDMGATEWVAAVAALFLVLNGIFGRCYLWHVLDITSCGCNDIPSERFCDRTAA